MSNLFRFFCCISLLQVTAEPDVFRFLLCKVPVVSLIIDFFCARVCGRKSFRLFTEYFIINFSRMCLRDQIFRVLLEHFISEVASK